MDSSQNPPSDQLDRIEIFIASPKLIDLAAEETCPAAPGQISAADTAPEPTSDVQTVQAPSARTLELMDQLETLANDFAVKAHTSSSDSVETVHAAANVSTGSKALESSIRASPRDQFAEERPPGGRRAVITLVAIFAAAAIGVFAWQHVSTVNSPDDVGAGRQQGSVSGTQVPASSGAVSPPSTSFTQSASTTSAELMKQIEAMAADLTLLRRTVEQLAAKQDQLAAAQQRFAAKQEQMDQKISKLQALEDNNRQKRSTSPQSQIAPMPPPKPPQSTGQLSSTPRSTLHPVPPLSVPP